MEVNFTLDEEPTEAENQETESTETENQDGGPTEAENQDDGEVKPEGEEKPEGETQDDPEGDEPEGKPINQEAVNRKINKLVAKRKMAEAKAEETAKELAEARKKLEELQGKTDDIVVPSLPDAYDPEYSAKVAERDRLLQEKAKVEAKKALIDEQFQKAAEEKQKANRQKYIDQTDAMYESGKKLGIKKEKLQESEKTLSMFIKDPALAQFILAHKDSALIVNHLANNLTELERISAMPGVNASVVIATELLAEAKKFKPSVSKAPAPLDIPSGKAGGNEDPFLTGVKFE